MGCHAAAERMQTLYQRSMFHLLRTNGQLAPALQAKITVVEVHAKRALCGNLSLTTCA